MTDGTHFETRSTWGSEGETLKLEIDPISHSAFPFGTKNMNLSNQRIEWFMRLKGGVFLSDTSIKKIDSTLIKSRKAKKQGKDRLDRGTNFFNDLTMLGVERNLPFRWRYQLVPNGTKGSNENR